MKALKKVFKPEGKAPVKPGGHDVIKSLDKALRTRAKNRQRRKNRSR